MVSLIDSLIEPRFLHRIGLSTFGNFLQVIRMSPYEWMGWKVLESNKQKQIMFKYIWLFSPEV